VVEQRFRKASETQAISANGSGSTEAAAGVPMGSTRTEADRGEAGVARESEGRGDLRDAILRELLEAQLGWLEGGDVGALRRRLLGVLVALG
jgi:hypothetical protein